MAESWGLPQFPLPFYRLRPSQIAHAYPRTHSVPIRRLDRPTVLPLNSAFATGRGRRERHADGRQRAAFGGRRQSPEWRAESHYASDTESVTAPPPELASLAGYPGRGIVLYRRRDGDVCWLYFVTGRSALSKQRRFVQHNGSLLVAPSEPSAAHDDLRHYACVTKTAGVGQIMVGNGDHVSSIARSLERGSPLREAVATLEPEPDPPINTPRIAAVIDDHNARIVTVRQMAGRTERLVESVTLEPEEGLLLYTYSGNDDLPVGSAPQLRFHIQTPQPVPKLVWQALNPDYRVMLAAGSLGSTEPDHILP